jgi:hypothetical protein
MSVAGAAAWSVLDSCDQSLIAFAATKGANYDDLRSVATLHLHCCYTLILDMMIRSVVSINPST